MKVATLPGDVSEAGVPMLREVMERLLLDPAAQTTWKSLVQLVIVPAVKQFLSENDEREQVRELTYELVGDSFMKQFLPGVTRDRKLLLPPYMAPSMRLELADELRQDLLAHVSSAIQSCGVLEEESKTEFHKHVNRVCKSMKPAKNMGLADVLGAIVTDAIAGRGFSFPLVDNVGNWPKREQKLIPRDHDIKASKCMHQGNLLQACKGRSLPLSLRKFIYMESLLDEQHVLDSGQEIIRHYQERGQVGMNILEKDSAHVSKIHNLLERFVDEALKGEMNDWCEGATEDEYQKKKACINAVLNTYFIMTGAHHMSTLSLAIPLVCDFLTPGLSTLALSCMLQKLEETLPSRGSTEDIAQRVLNRVQHLAPSLAASVRTLVEDCRSHTVNDVLREPVEQLKLEYQPHSIFMNWVENVLVGVLRPNAVHFTWTQCLLNGATSGSREKWNVQLFVSICARIFLLLEEKLTGLQSIAELQRVMRDAPKELTTEVLRNAVRADLTVEAT